jgi:predicted glycosyltransferase
MKGKKILFYVGHPAHYHNVRNLAARLEEKGYSVLIVARQKDVLHRLLENCPFETILLGGAKGNSKFSKALHLAGREIKMIRIALKHKPAMMIGTDMIISHVGKMLGIPSFILNEDDAEAVPLFAKLAYPLATGIFCPLVCSVGKYTSKKIGYAGYHELAYLHPRYFTPDPKKVQRLISDRPYFLLRFVDLNAHHDVGKKGINKTLALELIRRLSEKGNVFITSEKEDDPDFEPFRITIPPQDMHHAIAYAGLFIGDSQTMTAEAAVLGTPSVRFNDFVGQLQYLEELEYTWQLTYGFSTSQQTEMLQKLDELLAEPDLKKTWMQRRNRMLQRNTDLTALLEWFITGYPDTMAEVQARPDFYKQFITN